MSYVSYTGKKVLFSTSATWEAHIYPAKSKIDSYWEAAMKHRESSPSMDLWWPRGWDRCGEGKTRGRRHMHTHSWSVLLLEETNTALPSNILQFKQQQKNLTNYNDNQLLSQSFNRLGTQEWLRWSWFRISLAVSVTTSAWTLVTETLHGGWRICFQDCCRQEASAFCCVDPTVALPEWSQTVRAGFS